MTHGAIIIGAGVIGCSVAYHLSKAGVENVLILEMDEPASKASGRSTGSIATYKTREFGEDVSEYCNQFYSRLSDEHDDVILHFLRSYILAHSETMRENLKTMAANTETEAIFLEPDSFVEGESAFDRSSLTGALKYRQEVPHTDTNTATNAILRMARSYGATLRLEEVTLVENTSTGISVTTDQDTYRAPAVVNAAGAWSERVATDLGVAIPLKPRCTQVIQLQSDDPIAVPSFSSPEFGLYGRQQPNGDVIVGGGREEVSNPDSFERSASEGYIEEATEYVSRVANGWKNASVTRDWAGVVSATPDTRPIIGESSVEGFYLCCGFNGGGFKYAPFAGRLISDLITDQKSKFDPEPFAPGRFNGDEQFDITTAHPDNRSL